MNLTDITAALDALEPDSRQLEVNSTDRAKLLNACFEYANDFVEHIEQIPAFVPDPTDANHFKSEKFSEEGLEFETILSIVKKAVDRPGLNPASGGHLGYIPGGGIFPSAVADFLVAVFNRYAGIHFASPGAVKMENFLIGWMAGLVGYPSGAAGHLASGGSIANLTAIVTARDAVELHSSEYETAAIYLTEQVHHCIDKAIRIAGMEAAKVRKIEMDDHYRMNTSHLISQIEADLDAGLKPFLIVASAGTTDTGAIDPLDEIGEIAEQYNLWLHIDAAYGGFFQLIDQLRPQLKGIEKSDSVVVDPHKGLFLPYGIGAVIVKNAAALHRSHRYQAEYMQDATQNSEAWSPAELSPELTKHFRGMRMWLPLKLLGLKPFKSALWEKVLLARYFYEKIQAWEAFETGPYPDLSVVIYRYRATEGNGNVENLKLARMVQNDGRIFISSTTIYNKVWLRLAVLSFRTRKNTIDQLINILADKVKQL